ncbi:dipeptide/oligopeptide/nickel ABC transporter permease/ATP-binding protein [Aeromicrobium duanguangcaii]|uniref:Dipeptide/oligopeptide/nickel ABC transporter permease/ATP-binding protein n=1 Tax=Aeromicrobium duanguangcaii TaxID=2968086 RepID=A0ABY5KGQ0_9ACTN|nr:dipeptide/oligopeptide/nickel ABC transporter permease/ATP-binding protein [Aeromicrobium duanguangcaii]MCD9153393.1 dipeptide/oligopeptide/nickel ABC transporter permease/ATP-binding protein [Aeromicrobium duanguangcaii]UUI69515.1 dipeptide/oligopeptide/nickel ABC transporter permease/ATP-binding protein [Aeromicrobium duanguangcaii]
MSRRSWVTYFVRQKVPMMAAAYLALVLLLVLFAGAIAPYGPTEQNLDANLAGPSREHLLGTGQLGLDVFSRILWGGRTTLYGVLVAVVVFAVLGVSAGLLAGYLRGPVEWAVLRTSEVLQAVPAAIILLVVLAVFPGRQVIAMVALGVLGAPGLARVVRSVTLGVREELYVRSAQTMGLRPVAIMRRHVLPHLSGPVIVQLSLFGAAAVGLETALGFLRLGSGESSWGLLVAEASRHLGAHPWLMVPSGFVIMSFVMALGLVGDGVRDAVAASMRTRVESGARPRAATPPAPELPDSEDALVSVRGLTVSFPRGQDWIDVVRGVDLAVLPGGALGILGESGCGKSITAEAIVGRIRGTGQITAGEVRRRGRVGWVAQDAASSLDPSGRVGAQLAEVVRVHRPELSRSQVRARVLDLLERVRLPEPRRVARSRPWELSGGMAQRVGIAMALATDPHLIVADEPTSALDTTVQAEVLALFDELRADGMTLVVITHDVGVLAAVCDSAAVMYAGEVVELAPTQELLTHPAHPYTAALLAADPRRGTPGERLAAIDGTVPAPGSWPSGCRFADRCLLVTQACRETSVPLFDVDPADPTDAADPRVSRCLRFADVLDRTRA